MDKLRFALRTLARKPGFAAVAIVTLALGIAANLVIFTVVYSVLLKPLPYPEPERLAMIWEAHLDRPAAAARTTVNPLSYRDWRDGAESFSDIAAFNIWRPTLSGDGPPESVLGSIVTPNFFGVLGVRPMLGPGFVPDNGTPGRDRVAVLSWGLWQRRFGGDPGIVGRTIRVSGEPREVVGVMGPDYRHPEPSYLEQTEIFAPIAFSAEELNRRWRYLRTLGRLADGATMEEAGAELGAVARRLEQAYPETNKNMGVQLVALHEQIFGAVKPALLLLLVAAGLVMLIGCANVANLVLARGHGRRRELAVRTALGASRRHLARQLVGEHLLLTFAGGALALAASAATIRLARSVQTDYLSAIAVVRVDAPVVVFTALVSLAIGVAVGLLPALQASRADLRSSLSEETAAAAATRRGRRFRDALVLAEVAFAVVLLIGAGLLTRSFEQIVSQSPGFHPRDLLTFRVSPPRWRFAEVDDVVRFYDELGRRLEALPGASAAAFVTSLPFTTENWLAQILPGGESRPDERLRSEFHAVTPGYFQAMGIPLVAGRAFTADDDRDAPAVAMVNETLARACFAGEDPVGGRLVTDDGTAYTVVGVVADVLDDGYRGGAEPNFFVPFRQDPSRSMAVVLHTEVDPASLIAAVRHEVQELDGDTPLNRVRTMESLMASTVAPQRLTMLLADVFSLLALVLAGVGIYGVLSYTVSLRTREMGIRSALGAGRRDVLRLVIGQSMAVVASGIVLGVAAALASSRLIASFLFHVAPHDPATLAGVVAVLTAVAAVASYLPARKAARVDPTVAMRAEN